MEFEKLLRVRTLTGPVVRFVIKAPRNLARLLCSTKQSFCDNALVSGKPRTAIPGECGALAGGFSGFGLSLLPRYAGFSTAFGTSIGERGP